MTPDVYRAQAQVVALRRQQGLGAPTTPGSVAQAAIGATMPKVTFRSQVSPDFTYDPRQPTAGDTGGAGLAMRIMKPAVIVHTAAGPVTYAPYGDPKLNLFPLAVVLTVGAAGWLGWQAAKGLLR